MSVSTAQSDGGDATDVSREIAGIGAELLREFSRSLELASTRLAGLLDEGPGDAEQLRSSWGRKFLRLTKLGLERGMTTREISVASGLDDEPNAEKVLVQLEKSGRIELVPGASPKRWCLPREQRRNRILRASRLVPEGHWISYGDMAIAVSGNINVARAVSRVAAKNPAFANPHRVLEKAGTIPAGWEDDDGNGPAECERRLKLEGIELADGRAPRHLRLRHDDLRDLLEADEAREGAGV
jgi:alkylated DNA nucleotide flippase Atl1